MNDQLRALLSYTVVKKCTKDAYTPSFKGKHMKYPTYI